jgi:hypothetical protein
VALEFAYSYSGLRRGETEIGQGTGDKREVIGFVQ